MTRLVTPSEDAAVASESQVQLTLSAADAEQLRETLPWLLRALTDRPETPPRHRLRRQHAHALLVRLLNALGPEVTHADRQPNN